MVIFPPSQSDLETHYYKIWDQDFRTFSANLLMSKEHKLALLQLIFLGYVCLLILEE